eukprot:4281888-Prymnesium_polylepis.1
MPPPLPRQHAPARRWLLAALSCESCQSGRSVMLDCCGASRLAVHSSLGEKRPVSAAMPAASQLWSRACGLAF